MPAVATDLRNLIVILAVLVIGAFWTRAPELPERASDLAQLQVTPLNIHLAEKYFQAAADAWRLNDDEGKKRYILLAIAFDPELFSYRYRQFQRLRAELLNLKPALFTPLVEPVTTP